MNIYDKTIFGVFGYLILALAINYIGVWLWLKYKKWKNL